MRMGPWSETEHLDQYLELIGKRRAGRERKPFPGPHSRDRRQPSESGDERILSQDLARDAAKTASGNRPHSVI